MTLGGVVLFIVILCVLCYAVDRISAWQRSPKRLREKLMREQREIERKARGE